MKKFAFAAFAAVVAAVSLSSFAEAGFRDDGDRFGGTEMSISNPSCPSARMVNLDDMGGNPMIKLVKPCL